MNKIYIIAVLIGGGILLNHVKNDQQFDHCMMQAAELDTKLSTINQLQNVHFLATEYVAVSEACKGGMPKFTSTPNKEILADAEKPATIEEGKKKAAKRKAGNPLL